MFGMILKILEEYDGFLLPGGFSYGDYLRSGAIARFSNVMTEVVKAAEAGKPVLVFVMDFKFYLKQACFQGL